MACAVCVCVYIALSVVFFVARHFADSTDLASLHKAVRLEPSNAEYRWRIGAFQFYNAKDTQAAALDFENAIHLNPFNARYWMDYAGALFNLGHLDESRTALERAIRLNPTRPDLNWQAGNLYLALGDTNLALHRFRTILDRDDKNPEYSVLPMCWRVTHDPELLIKEALPPRADVYLRFLDLVVSENNDEAAKTIWTTLSKFDPNLDPKQVFPYFDFLVMHKDVAQSAAVWNYIASQSHMQDYRRPDDLVVNGSFEEPLLNGGFDWRYHEVRAVTLSIDDEKFHTGRQSLSISFSGENADAGVVELVPVEKNSTYEFSTYAKAQNIQGAGGPQFQIQDLYDKHSLLLTDEMTETFNWRLVRGEFHTGAEDSLVAIRIVRIPGNTLVRGKLWIDDVSVRRK